MRLLSFSGVVCVRFLSLAVFSSPAISTTLPQLESQVLLEPHANAPVTIGQPEALADLKEALNTLQTAFFSLTSGSWPTAIDWTAAVLETHLAAGISSLSVPDYALSNKYFAQLVAFYYGQNWESLEQQAYDDMLWVVLGWLEAVKMIDYRVETLENGTWTGEEWRDTFAARARLFYELAEHGWDTTLCGGGMVWSPWLEPYKNAITNELFISASISMYLYYPTTGRNQTYLDNALKALAWLRESNMTDVQGLYTDGFHISELYNSNVTNKTCDDRNEMVYTYNQGVLLSGLRGLAEATGEPDYITEGHTLVDAVITSQSSIAPLVIDNVLTEMCDPTSSCSQNGQTFKGIFMHHLTLFCAPLPADSERGLSAFSEQVRSAHAERCAKYYDFIAYNAQKAWATRNSAGVVGAWWAAPAGQTQLLPNAAKYQTPLPPGAVDYQNVYYEPMQEFEDEAWKSSGGDLNDRGRGRTVESHSGGLAAMRAVLEVIVARAGEE